MSEHDDPEKVLQAAYRVPAPHGVGRWRTIAGGVESETPGFRRRRLIPAGLGVALLAATAVGVFALASAIHRATPPIAHLTPPAHSGSVLPSPPSGSPHASPGVTPSPTSTSATPEPTKSGATPTPTQAGATPSPPPPGWPGPTNTGVPAGTTLTAAGPVVVATAGQTIDARDISGCISIQGNNVTIKRTRIRSNGSDCNGRLIDAGTYTGTMISDVEIDGLNQLVSSAGIGDSGYTCLRCNIHHIGTGMHLLGGTLQDSWIHSLNNSSGNAVITNGPTNGVVIRHNRIEDIGGSAAIALYADFGAIHNVTVDNNMLDGGSYTLYGGSTPKPYSNQTSGIVVTNNRFGRNSAYGSDADYDSARPGNVWTGNVWDDTGQPVSP